jgi:hypothetical protein
MAFKVSDNPYLADNKRLADVIAAIQVMGIYKFYKLDFRRWGERITGIDDEDTSMYWKQVFEDHPEFFRLDNERLKASLVWRRQYPKKYHVDLNRIITSDDGKVADDRLSRNPLTQTDINSLIGIAINLHSKALEQKRDQRWFIPLIIGFIGTLIGATAVVASAYLKLLSES